MSTFWPQDLEKGATSNDGHTKPPTTPAPKEALGVDERSRSSDPDEDDYKGGKTADEKLPKNVSENKSLHCFRYLSGFNSDEPGKYEGIYQQAVEKGKAEQKKYILSSYLINVCMGSQIVVAAVLTALGASDAPHAVVTVLGVINTVIAGFLAYMKSSGLPNRPKIFQTQWSGLQDYIELRERGFKCGHRYLKGAHDEFYIIEDMYKRIKADIEAIMLDGHTSVARAREMDR
jgi:hypothetical protein